MGFSVIERYQNLKQKHYENVDKFFKKLVSDKNIDVEANQQTSQLVYQLSDKKQNQTKSASWFKISQVIIWLIVGVLIISFICLIYFAVQKNAFLFEGLAALIVGLFIPIFIYLGVFTYQKAKIVGAKLAKTNQQLDDAIELANRQLGPIFSSLNMVNVHQLFNQTNDLIKLDEYFSMQRFLQMEEYAGIELLDDNQCTIYCLSGLLSDNPFFIAKILTQSMVDVAYNGSLVVQYRINNQVVTETLIATIYRPKAIFEISCLVAYTNLAAPNLSFHRYCQNVSIKTDKQIVKDSKKMQKQAQKQGAILLNNPEFEAIFSGLERSNDVEYRLLFTPLAQIELTKLLKDTSAGYGDDFDFFKDGKLVGIWSTHLQGFNLNASSNSFVDINLQVVSQRFYDYCLEYLRQIYFALAPIIAIPIFIQTKPLQYVNDLKNRSKFSIYEYEKIIHDNIDMFIHEASNTQNIIKLKIVESNLDYDVLQVYCFGFHIVPQIAIGQAIAGNGRVYNIPISWDHYDLVSCTSKIQVNQDGSLTNYQLIEKS